MNKIKMKGFIIVSLLTLILATLGGFQKPAEASAVTDFDVEPIALSQETIDIADPYIQVKQERFVIADNQSLISKLGEEEYQKVVAEVNDRNSILNQATSTEMKDLHIINNHIQFSESAEDLEIQASKGKNGIKTYWWGYKLYMNNNLTNTTAQALTAGAGAGTLVAIWAPWFSAPTALLKAIGATVALVFGGAAAMFYKTNKGKGVYLRFTGVRPAAVVYTGMFAQ